MQREDRRRFLRDVRHGRGLPRAIGEVGRRTADQADHGRIGLARLFAHKEGREKITRPAKIHNAGDVARLAHAVADLPIERLHVAAGSHEQREMAPRRTTSHANAVGIDAEFQRIAALQSWIWAGHFASPERR